MPTYRVYLARPSTKPPLWDWMQTVYASDASIALTNSYADWLDSDPTPTPPPLYLCRRNVVAKTAVLALAAADGANDGQNAFVAALQQQVSQLLGTQLDGTFQVVSYPSGFNYGITWGNNAYWNAATLDDLDTRLASTDNGKLELTGDRLSTLYAQILPAVAFMFSQADQQTMQKQDTAASAQIASVITEFVNAGGTFTSPLPLGGKLQDIFNQLTQAYGSLDKLPDSLNSLRNAIAAYKQAAGASYALHNRYYAATARLGAALANTTNPGSGNGGMQTDTNAWHVGYDPKKLPTANQLIASLSNQGSKVQLDIKLYNFTSTSSQLSISGSAGITIPIFDVLDLSIGGSASYDLSRYASAETSVTMSFSYPGVTLVGTAPSDLSANNQTGWYADDIVTEIAANTPGTDVTGYQIQGSEFDPAKVFGVGKPFSRLKTFVISQQPTITMVFSYADSSRIVSDLKVNAEAKLKLFDLFTIGQVSASYHVTDVKEDSQAGTVTVTFAPPPISGTTPLQNQVAYVMGGVPSYPPDNI